MIEHSDHLLEYTYGCSSMDEFSKDIMLVEACVFNLVQIGELAHSELSDSAKESLNTIPWRQIYGMRNRIVHGYSSVNFAVVWETITNDIKPLKHQLEESLR